MGTFYSNTLTAISNMDTWVFEYPGNLSSKFPSSQLEGIYTSDVANYFYNIAPLFIADNSTFLEMVQEINITISAGLAGAALGAGDYYIVKNGMTLEDCSSNPTCAEYEGNSYQLGYPGAAGCIKRLSIGTWATSDTIDALGTYGINLTELVSISETCQDNTQRYFGTMTAGITPSDIYSSGNLPQCFYNLAVFFIFDNPAYASAEWDSPCYVTTTNSSATTAEVGFTYLPNNLSPYFTATDCECGDGYTTWPG